MKVETRDVTIVFESSRCDAPGCSAPTRKGLRIVSDRGIISIPLFCAGHWPAFRALFMRTLLEAEI